MKPSKQNRNLFSRRSFGGIAAFGAAALANTNARAQNRDASVSLRILCYNIHYGQGNDGKYDIPRIAAAIKQLNPDLVALQEIDVHVARSGRIHELRMLAEETGMAGRFGPTQHYQGGLYGNGILSKLPFHDVHIQPLPYTEATPTATTYPRAAVAAIVEAEGGKRLRFISTHFQHASFEEDRFAEAKAINDHFAADDPANDTMGPEAAKLPTILAGDLNAVPGSPPIVELQKKWHFAVEDDPVPSSPSIAPKNRIDFILHRLSDPVKVTTHYVVDEKVASDHNPVYAEVEIH